MAAEGYYGGYPPDQQGYSHPYGAPAPGQSEYDRAPPQQQGYNYGESPAHGYGAQAPYEGSPYPQHQSQYPPPDAYQHHNPPPGNYEEPRASATLSPYDYNQHPSSRPGSAHGYQSSHSRGYVPGYDAQSTGPGGYAHPGPSDPGAPGGGHEGERGLGATLLGAAGGGFVGHEAGGGALGTIAGTLIGAIGANVLENRHEKRRRSTKSTRTTPV
ncbi:hypothetical protein L228DRAFT_113989 [Xylona heveae TC161]|uniref:Glycine zipper 2TM domain-containing protein n=1 Tax=Xylona heveae (strain CBS 132557 / TC161) TaxID=1328760 RepID=A0A161TC55_XYLHT|nr:hypothetical protein L228DRAFT_113989 [Xylona heveae TC161]KZF23327.1 hypothetical protein L228DRAFT_113989 [Xylona heveae TC161]